MDMDKGKGPRGSHQPSNGASNDPQSHHSLYTEALIWNGIAYYNKLINGIIEVIIYTIAQICIWMWKIVLQSCLQVSLSVERLFI